MRPERLYLNDIAEAAEAIEGFLSGVGEADFLRSDLIQSAVLQKLTVIGEAAARLPVELYGRYPEIPWRDIVAFRNIAVHAYFAVEWSIVWVAATDETRLLKHQIGEILDRDFADAP